MMIHTDTCWYVSDTPPNPDIHWYAVIWIWYTHRSHHYLKHVWYERDTTWYTRDTDDDMRPKNFKCLSIEGVVSFVSVRITVYHGGCDTLRCYGKIHVRYDVDTYMIHNDTQWYTSDTLLICMWYTLTHLFAHPRGNDVPPKEQEKPPPLAMLSTWWGRSQERSTACSLGPCLPEDSSLCHCVPQYDTVWYSVINCDTDVIPSGKGCVSDDCARVGGVLWRRISVALACISFGQSALQTDISVNLLVSSNIRHVSDDTYESRISHDIIPYHACISFGISELYITCITTYHIVSAVSAILYHGPVSRTPKLSHCDTADCVIQDRVGAAGDMVQKPAILYHNISEHIRAYHKERAAAPISCVSRISYCIMLYQRRCITTYDIVWYSVIQCDTKPQTNQTKTTDKPVIPCQYRSDHSSRF